MVIAKRRLPKLEASEDLTFVAEKLRNFDVNAPIGAFNIDKATRRLLEARSLPGVVPFRLVRRHMKNCCASGLSTVRAKAERGSLDAAGRSFGHKLAALRSTALDVSNLDTSNFFDYAAVTRPEDGDTAEREIELIDDELDRIKLLSRKLVARIDHLNGRVDYIGAYSPPNRVVPFTFGFIQALAQSWHRMFSQPPSRRDLSDMTFLMAMSLVDFGYVLSPSQRKSDVWLSDRIRKQIFGN